MEWVSDILAVWGYALCWWLGLCAAFFVLTKLTPCNPGRSWWADRRAALTDLTYWLILPFFTSVGRIAFLVVGVMLLYGREPSADEFAARGWPLWCQCVVILLLQDVLMYWIHRLFHRSTLWEFHAVHHSPEVVDWTSASRFHPVNAVAEFALADAVVLLMGFDPVALAILGPINMIVSTMVHANLNWTFGPLRYVFASPVFHRWHHTAEAEGLDKNFAPTFPFLDVLFGTFHMPKGRVPVEYGAVGERVPRGVLGQTVYPARGGWAWAKRRPISATAAVGIAVAVGWFGWQKFSEFGEPQPRQEEQSVATNAAPPEPRRLNLTLAPATAVAVNAESRRLVRGLADGTVVLLDTADGRELARMNHRMRVNAVAISPNGAIVASAGGDGTIHVLDGITGARLRLLKTDRRNPLSVAVSSDGWVAAGLVDGTACLWDASGARVKERILGAGAVHAVALSDGGRVVVAARQSRVSAWDVATDTLTDFDGPRELAYCVAVRPDGGAVACGTYGGKLFRWDRTATAPKSVGTGHVGPIYSVAFPGDGQSVVSGGADRVVRVWDGGRVVGEFAGHAGPLFAVSATGTRVLATGKDDAPTEWGTRSDQLVPAAAAMPGE